MRPRFILLGAALAIFTLASLSCAGRAVGSDDEVAVIVTNYGRIVIEFFPQDAPKHVANFKELAREKFYDGQKVFRLIKNKGIPVAFQAGDPNTINGNPSTWGLGQPDQPTVPAELSATRKHVRGTVSAARKGDNLDSATSQFFICVANYPAWDGQYSIFGRVIKGMNVVDAIALAPVYGNSDKPVDPVSIERVYIARPDEVKD